MPLPGFGEKRRFLLVLTACIAPLVSAFLVLYSSSSAISVGPDSVSYLSVANHLVDGSGFQLFDGQAYVGWSPLYPMLLATLKSVGFDPVGSAPVANAIMMAAITLVSSLWIISHLTDGISALFGILLVTFSPPLIYFSRWLLSETPFFLLLLLSLILLDQYGRGSRKTLVGAGILASLAWLTRYAGVTVAITGILLILSRGIKRKSLQDAVIFAACAGIPAALWMARNWLAAGTFTGERPPSSVSLLTNLDLTIRVLSAWFTPETLGDKLGGLILAVLWSGAITVAIVIVYRKARLPVRPRSLSRLTGLPSYPFLLFSLCYGLFMLMAATTVAFESLDNRMLLPLYLPVVFLMVSFFDQLRRSARENQSRYAGAMPVIMLIVLAATPVYHGILNGIQASHALTDFNSALWHQSETIDALRNSAITGTLYSDSPYPVYLLLQQPVYQLPRKFFYNSAASPAGELADFVQAVQQSKVPVYLAWFDWPTNFLFSFDELRQVVDLRPVNVYPDGTLYEIHPKQLAVLHGYFRSMTG